MEELRHRFKAALAGAGLTVDAGAGPVPVTVLETPPAGWVVPDEKLPALYVFSEFKIAINYHLVKFTKPEDSMPSEM